MPGIAEVLHARFTDHAYPAHVHDTWTLMLGHRSFRQAFGLPPHAYLTGLRVAKARRRLLAAMRPAGAAVAAGF